MNKTVKGHTDKKKMQRKRERERNKNNNLYKFASSPPPPFNLYTQCEPENGMGDVCSSLRYYPFLCVNILFTKQHDSSA